MMNAPRHEVTQNSSSVPHEKLAQELRRGILVLAVLSQLEDAEYGYSLQQHLAEKGMAIEQGTLYPLLRRLDEEGLLVSEWIIEGARPRKYYRRSEAGTVALQALTGQWKEIVAAMDVLLDGAAGEMRDGAD